MKDEDSEKAQGGTVPLSGGSLSRVKRRDLSDVPLLRGKRPLEKEKQERTVTWRRRDAIQKRKTFKNGESFF